MFRYKEVCIVLVLLLVVGCANISSLTKRDNKQSEEPIFLGEKGLEPIFEAGAPPKEVFKDAPFDVVVSLYNRGALDITKGTAVLSIPLTFDVSGSTSQSFTNIPGKISVNQGGLGEVRWSGIDVKQTTVRQDSNQRASVDVCYEGEISAQPEICVRPREGSPGIIAGECILGEKKLSGGQGGPIAVVSVFDNNVVYQPDGTKQIRFQINVENKDSGEVINREKVDNCRLTPRDRQFADVNIEVGWLDGTPFKCQNDGKLKLNNGRGYIICETQTALPGDAHYPTPLNIKMNYGYVKGIKTSFTLKKDVVI